MNECSIIILKQPLFTMMHNQAATGDFSLLSNSSHWSFLFTVSVHPSK